MMKSFHEPPAVAPLTSSPNINEELTQVGPYVVGKTLGVGSTGRVKLGIHKVTGFKVAIKIISKCSLKIDKEMQDKIEREIAIMKLIDHPHVLAIYDVYESDAHLFLILEHVEGGELFDYLVKQGRIPPEESLVFFQQIISAMEFCHAHYVCHRDLKPENLLLDNDKNIKIADFGMASLQLQNDLCSTSCGSPHYASPEVIRGEKYDGRSADLWSCGIILYALLTGCLPFDDEDVHVLFTKVKVGSFKIPQFVPSEAHYILRRLITVNPTKRLSIMQVKSHPWFRSNNNPLIYRDPPIYDNLPQITKEDLVDQDVVEYLKKLGCFKDKKAIMASLSASEGNVPKMLYYLLLERKLKQPSIEDYDTYKITNNSISPQDAYMDIVQESNISDHLNNNNYNDICSGSEDSLGQLQHQHQQSSSKNNPYTELNNSNNNNSVTIQVESPRHSRYNYYNNNMDNMNSNPSSVTLRAKNTGHMSDSSNNSSRCATPRRRTDSVVSLEQIELLIQSRTRSMPSNEAAAEIIKRYPSMNGLSREVGSVYSIGNSYNQQDISYDFSLEEEDDMMDSDDSNIIINNRSTTSTPNNGNYIYGDVNLQRYYSHNDTRPSPGHHHHHHHHHSHNGASIGRALSPHASMPGSTRSIASPKAIRRRSSINNNSTTSSKLIRILSQIGKKRDDVASDYVDNQGNIVFETGGVNNNPFDPRRGMGSINSVDPKKSNLSVNSNRRGVSSNPAAMIYANNINYENGLFENTDHNSDAGGGSGVEIEVSRHRSMPNNTAYNQHSSSSFKNDSKNISLDDGGVRGDGIVTGISKTPLARYHTSSNDYSKLDSPVPNHTLSPLHKRNSTQSMNVDLDSRGFISNTSLNNSNNHDKKNRKSWTKIFSKDTYSNAGIKSVSITSSKTMEQLASTLPKILEYNYVVITKINLDPYGNRLQCKCLFSNDEEDIKFKILIHPSKMDSTLCDITITPIKGDSATFQSLCDNIFKGIRITSSKSRSTSINSLYF